MNDKYESHQQDMEENKHFVGENKDSSQDNFRLVPGTIIIPYDTRPFFINLKLFPFAVFFENSCTHKQGK